LHIVHNSSPSVNSNTKPSLPALLPTPSLPSTRPNNTKKISPAKMQLRWEKGLCYFCDDKFTFNHKCPNRHVMMLQLEETNEDHQELQSELQCMDSHKEDHHLSLNALKRGLGVGTIRFQAYINQLPISVLIDGGSSDNFIQPRIARSLKYPIEPVIAFKVMVSNGNYMFVEGRIKELTIKAQGNSFSFPVFLLPISRADLILGAS